MASRCMTRSRRCRFRCSKSICQISPPASPGSDHSIIAPAVKATYSGPGLALVRLQPARPAVRNSALSVANCAWHSRHFRGDIADHAEFKRLLVRIVGRMRYPCEMVCSASALPNFRQGHQCIGNSMIVAMFHGAGRAVFRLVHASAVSGWQFLPADRGSRLDDVHRKTTVSWNALRGAASTSITDRSPKAASASPEKEPVQTEPDLSNSR